MGKNLIDKVKEQEKQSHEEFRRKVMEDIQELFRQWEEHADYINTKRISEYSDATRKMETLCKETKEIGNDLTTIKRSTMKEIEKLKIHRTWKRYAYSFLFGLLGSLTGIIICGLYWPKIRGLLS